MSQLSGFAPAVQASGDRARKERVRGLKERRRPLGLDGLYVGVPVKLGAGGVEEIIEFDLADDELAALRKSADAVRELVEVMKNA